MITKQEDFIRKLIREELDKFTVNKSFNLKNEFIVSIASELKNSYNDVNFNYDKLINRVAKLIQTDFNINKTMLSGVENFPESIKLYRLINVFGGDEIDENNIGIHWTYSKKLLYDNLFLSSIGMNPNEMNNVFIVEGVFDKQDVDIYNTIVHNLITPIEAEITIKLGAKPVSHRLFNY